MVNNMETYKEYKLMEFASASEEIIYYLEKQVEMLERETAQQTQNLLAYAELVESMTRRIIRLEQEINKLEMM
jgi:hypothetical protein